MLTILMLILACTAPDSTREALEAQGFTDVETGGYTVFGCGQDDTFHTEFTATNAQGQRVSGVACCGVMKNCTLRW